MAQGMGDSCLSKRNRDTAEEAQKAASCTRIIGKKRVSIPQDTGELPFSSPLKTSRRKRRRMSSQPEAMNHLELLPQDILIRVLCYVNHGDLKQLIVVSKTIHDAALIAKELHFAFTTPMPKLTFKGYSREKNADVCDSHETPNAPTRISRIQYGGKDLLSVAAALFASSDEL